MFDFAADFGTDVRNVSDLASYTATGTCRIGFYITSEAEWLSHDGTYRIAMVSCNRNGYKPVWKIIRYESNPVSCNWGLNHVVYIGLDVVCKNSLILSYYII